MDLKIFPEKADRFNPVIPNQYLQIILEEWQKTIGKNIQEVYYLRDKFIEVVKPILKNTNGRAISIEGSSDKRSHVNSATKQLVEDFVDVFAKNNITMINSGGKGIPALINEHLRKSSKNHVLTMGIKEIAKSSNVKNNIFLAEEYQENFIQFERYLWQDMATHFFSQMNVFFPGGIGTKDSLFGITTLIQTGRAAPTPIPLMQTPGSKFWEPYLDLSKKTLLKPECKVISDNDPGLLENICTSPLKALDQYENMHSYFVDVYNLKAEGYFESGHEKYDLYDIFTYPIPDALLQELSQDIGAKVKLVATEKQQKYQGIGYHYQFPASVNWQKHQQMILKVNKYFSAQGLPKIELDFEEWFASKLELLDDAIALMIKNVQELQRIIPKVFNKSHHAAVFFGSARINNPLATEIGRAFQRFWITIISGGGPAVMEDAHRPSIVLEDLQKMSLIKAKQLLEFLENKGHLNKQGQLSNYLIDNFDQPNALANIYPTNWSNENIKQAQEILENAVDISILGIVIRLSNGEKPHSLFETRRFKEYFVKFDLFAWRKMFLFFFSKAYLVFNGGYGTFDELFEVMKLVQRGSIPPYPIMLIVENKADKENMFKKLEELIKKEVEKGEMDPVDIALFRNYVCTGEEALQKYSNFNKFYLTGTKIKPSEDSKSSYYLDIFKYKLPKSFIKTIHKQYNVELIQVPERKQKKYRGLGFQYRLSTKSLNWLEHQEIIIAANNAIEKRSTNNVE